MAYVGLQVAKGVVVAYVPRSNPMSFRAVASMRKPLYLAAPGRSPSGFPDSLLFAGSA